MKNIWSYITYLTSYLTLSPVSQDAPQQSLLDPHDVSVVAVHNEINVVNVVAPAVSNSVSTTDDNESLLPWPIFAPPTRKIKWAGSDFECDYPDMGGWEPCAGENRSCWLRKPGTSEIFDIGTDYEKFKPKGIIRDYTLVVEDGQWNADGMWAKNAKLINGTYPGPLIQACWGDTLRVKVINKLKHNGTAIHWHGIRQNQTMHMDGVPGITQCPIAPNDYFVYQFDATQYGDSWYHSHYSVQYADGMLGPITIHGPTTAHWDEPKAPTLMSDWFHNSAFQVIHDKIAGYPTVVLNGTGDISKHLFTYKYDNGTDREDPADPDKPLTYRVVPNAPIPQKYQLLFEKPKEKEQSKKYLLRLINTSFSTTFVFSIDNHYLTIVGADFVPVWPSSKKTHVQIGIGQRYTVIVEAKPVNHDKRDKYPTNDNFWIRTTIVKCFKANAMGIDDYDRLGVLRYDPNDTQLPNSTLWGDITKDCRDETHLAPRLYWDLEGIVPANGDYVYGQELTVDSDFKKGPTKKFPLGKWAFDTNVTQKDGSNRTWTPLQIDYHDPFFLHLNELDRTHWPPSWMVIPANYSDTDWVFLAITGMGAKYGTPGSFTANHPIHLHGHDFALLQVEEKKPFNYANLDFNTTNPLRRDVVLLPAEGWIVIAFKADNPGSWIVHCHIAFHASEGLAFQINERQADADALWPNRPEQHAYHEAISEAKRVCRRWKNFESDCTQHWPGKDEERNCWPACNTGKEGDSPYACPTDAETELHVFQDDSGV